MMMGNTLPRLTVLGMVAALLAGCAAGSGNKQQVGAVIGAAAGGLLGSTVGSGDGRLAAVAAGTFIGTVVGSEIGKAMDRQDRLLMSRASHEALETHPSGQSATWHNPDTGHRGAVTPQPAYQNAEGQYCREFTQEIVVGGRVDEGYGTACRQPDGSWKII